MHLDLSWTPFVLIVFLSLNFIKKWKNISSSNRLKKKLPPGPMKLPIIGNFHNMMGSLPHHALRNLAQKHGDLMHLQLGEISNIVVSSARAAEAILKTNDHAFANRPSVLAGKIVFYDSSDIVFSPYGEYWKQVRKLCSMELLSPKIVRSLGSVRQAEISNLVSSIRESAQMRPKQGINVFNTASSYTSSVVCKAAFGRTFNQHRTQLIELMKEVILRMSGYDVSDVFPSWTLIHHLSLMKPKLLKLRKKVDEIIDIIIQEHVDSPTRKNGEFGEEDLVDVMLRINGGGGGADLQFPITNTNIKAIVLDMFTGGTTTSATVVEWAMAEMMRNPDVMAKAQREIRKALPVGTKTIEENDIQHLTYLKWVVKEILRLHPPAPLTPRECMEQCEIDGYTIPLKTRVVINIWAIGRDPKYWDDPESFRPERFENNSVDFLGTNYEYVPFGGGKRVCPGMSFGVANIEVLLANLLYFFDWTLPNGIESTGLDMSEGYGFSAAKKNNLFLVPSVYA